MFYHVPYALDNIAQWYRSAPAFVEDTKVQWVMLAQESHKQVERLFKIYDVELLRVTGQPYADCYEMFDDIDAGKLMVSIDTSEHPVFTLEDNIAFRIWHDLAHHEAYADFSYHGEVETYEQQLAHIERFSNFPYKDVRHALFVEVLGQAASAIVAGTFAQQKVF